MPDQANEKFFCGLDFFHILILAIFSTLMFTPWLSQESVWFDSDFAPQIIPYFHWLGQVYKSGQIPLWSQGVTAGYPFYDEGLSGYWYPPLKILLSNLSAFKALNWFYSLHAFWSGLGVYWFLRLKIKSKEASFFGAVAATFCGPMYSAVHHYVNFAALAWLPWQFLGLELIFGKNHRHLIGAAILGASVGLAVCGGHLVIVIYGLVTLALYALWRVWEFEKLKDNFPKILTALLLSIFLAGLLCFGQLKATQRYVKESSRQKAFSYETASLGSLAPASLAQMLLPFAFGDPSENSFLGKSWPGGSWLYQGMLVYVGLGVLVFSVYAAFYVPRRAGPFLIVALLVLLYALGSYTPFHYFVYKLPFFGHFRAPAKALSLWGFLLAYPAAIWMEIIIKDRVMLKKTVLTFVWMAIFFLLLWIGFYIFKTYWNTEFLNYIQTKVSGSVLHQYPLEYYIEKLSRYKYRLELNLLEQFLWAASLATVLGVGFLKVFKPNRAGWIAFLMASLIFGEVFFHTRSVHPRVDSSMYTLVPPGAERVLSEKVVGLEPFRFMGWGWSEHYRQVYPLGRVNPSAQKENLLNALLGDHMSLLFGLENLRGYLPISLRRYNLIFGEINDFIPGISLREQTDRLLERKKVLDLMGVKYIISALDLDANWELLEKEPVRVYRNPQALPMAWIAKEITDASDEISALEKYLNQSEIFMAVLESPKEKFVKLGHGEVTWVEKNDQRWVLKTFSDRSSLLVLSRIWYPSIFKVLVDGVETDFFPVNGVLSGVWVKPGICTVEIKIFDPQMKVARLSRAGGWLLLMLLLGFGFKSGQEQENEKN
jgi:hypothetical protein